MHALYCLFIDEQQKERDMVIFRDYVGQALWHITSIQHMKTTEPNSMPQYIEFAHPEKKVRVEPLTAEQIKQRVLEKLRC